MFIPTKVKPDPKARGWKPKRGWYVFDTTKVGIGQALDLSEGYGTKTACWEAIARKLGVSVSEAKKAL